MGKRKKKPAEDWRKSLLNRYLAGQPAAVAAFELGQSFQVVQAFYRLIAKGRGDQMPEDEEAEKTKVLATMSKELHEWLKQEAKTSGRTVSFMVENAVKQWRDKLERGRKN